MSQDLIEVISLKDKKTIYLTEKFHKPLEVLWGYFTEPKDIVKWFSISEEYYCSFAFNSLREGDIFMYRMSPKKEGVSFDIEGRFKEIQLHKLIRCSQDGTELMFSFEQLGEEAVIKLEIQYSPDNKFGDMSYIWKALLNNFKKYVDNL